jgi:hypothetical protein
MGGGRGGKEKKLSSERFFPSLPEKILLLFGITSEDFEEGAVIFDF